jgi:serine/threonine protein kinase
MKLGGFGRIFKMEHIETKVVVAIKERVNDSEVYLKAWQQEIENLKMVLEKVKNLTTSRLIAVIDDTKKNIKDKYIIMEWIGGKNLLFFCFFFKI